MPFVEEQPRRIETIEDVEAVLDSLRVSWHELLDCIEIARCHDRTDLVERAARRSREVAGAHMNSSLRVRRTVQAFFLDVADIPGLRTAVRSAVEWFDEYSDSFSALPTDLRSELRKTRNNLTELDEYLTRAPAEPRVTASSYLRRLGLSELAVVFCTQVLVSDSRDTAALTCRGAAQTDLGHYEEAKSDLRNLSPITPCI